jgi:hypothetical protein
VFAGSRFVWGSGSAAVGRKDNAVGLVGSALGVAPTCAARATAWEPGGRSASAA